MNICMGLLLYFLLFIILLLNISFTDSRNNARQSPPKDHKNPSESEESHGNPKTNVVKCERKKCQDDRTCGAMVKNNRKSKGQVSNERSAENRSNDDRRTNGVPERYKAEILVRKLDNGRTRLHIPRKYGSLALLDYDQGPDNGGFSRGSHAEYISGRETSCGHTQGGQFTSYVEVRGQENVEKNTDLRMWDNLNGR
ncbi:hypothetical protein Ddc_22847 [Ditylenchus destructor]|nr:hypothetical protein Ddc_22847 [Ditylenchus destructor]